MSSVALLEKEGNGTHTTTPLDEPIKLVLCRKISREMVVAFGWVGVAVSVAGVLAVVLRLRFPRVHQKIKWWFVGVGVAVAIVTAVLSGLSFRCAALVDQGETLLPTQSNKQEFSLTLPQAS